MSLGELVHPFRIGLFFTFCVLATACGGGGGGSSSSEIDAEDEMLDTAETLGPEDAVDARLIRIMPIGDSLTEGQTGWNTYRYFLWNMLQDSGFPVDFVGSREGVLGGGAPDPNFDQDHEGHWSWRTDELLDYGFEIWSAQYPTDIALIFIGLNDMREERTVGQTLANYARIIELLRLSNPRVAIFLGTIIPSDRDNDKVLALNAAMPSFAQAQATENSPIFVVDQYTGFSLETDTRDGIHPDDSGERKIAGNWFNALSPFLVELID